MAANGSTRTKIDANAKSLVGIDLAQAPPTEAKNVNALFDREVTLLRRVNRQLAFGSAHAQITNTARSCVAGSNRWPLWVNGFRWTLGAQVGDRVFSIDLVSEVANLSPHA